MIRPEEDFMALQTDAMRVLEETSRTFFLPIERLPKGLKEAVASAYLCMRAIDEVEDHPTLDSHIKARILQGLGLLLQAQTSVENFAYETFNQFFSQFDNNLPEVTVRIADWACFAPRFIAPRIWEATAGMADRMAHWALNGFYVADQDDLDRYTYSVAGTVGLLLCDLWGWFEKVQIHRSHGIQFGRGLQLVNIIRNRQEDLERGVDFYPPGWDEERMTSYARENLDGFSEYAATLPKTTFLNFISIPRALAYATLDAIASGKEKLSRLEVVKIVANLENPIK
jgi:farnesyl-diphosphate farnesyltransferase